MFIASYNDGRLVLEMTLGEAAALKHSAFGNAGFSYHIEDGKAITLTPSAGKLPDYHGFVKLRANNTLSFKANLPVFGKTSALPPHPHDGHFIVHIPVAADRKALRGKKAEPESKPTFTQRHFTKIAAGLGILSLAIIVGSHFA